MVSGRRPPSGACFGLRGLVADPATWRGLCLAMWPSVRGIASSAVAGAGRRRLPVPSCGRARGTGAGRPREDDMARWGENYDFRTPNIGLRNYRHPNIEFIKITFETLSLCYIYMTLDVFSSFLFLFHIFEVCNVPFAPLCFCCTPRRFVCFPIETPVRLVVFDRELGPAPWRIPALRSLHQPPAPCAVVVAAPGCRPTPLAVAGLSPERAPR